MASVDIGDKVVYLGGKEGTWTCPMGGKGIATIMSYHEARLFFQGVRVPQGEICRGPAVHLRFVHNNLDLWVEPSEIRPLSKEETQ